jgi:hypothetical protein
MSDHADEGLDAQRALVRILHAALRRLADPEQFRYRPWSPPGLSQEAFRSQVADALEESGHWEITGEMRMGAEPLVRITKEYRMDQTVIHVSVSYGITMSADCRSIEDALRLGALFANLVWEIFNAKVVDELVWSEQV